MGDKKTKTKATKADELKKLQADLAKALKENESLKKSAKGTKSKEKTFDERVDDKVSAVMNKFSEDGYRKSVLEGLSGDDKKNESLISAKIDALKSNVRSEAVIRATKQVNKEINEERTVSEFESAKAKAVEAGLPEAIADKADSVKELELAEETYKEFASKTGGKKGDEAKEEVDDIDTDIASGDEDETEGDEDDTDYGASDQTELFAKLGASKPGSKEYNETMDALNGVAGN